MWLKGKTLKTFHFITPVAWSLILLQTIPTIASGSASRGHQENWVALQARHCGMTCQNGTIVYSETCSPEIHCFRCDCDQHCDLLGTCCPSYDTSTNTYHLSFETSMEKNPHHWYKRFECRRQIHTKEEYLTVSKCPESWNDEYVREKCEHSESKRDSWLSITPFTHKVTRLVFPNAFCAVCNGFQISNPRSEDAITKLSDSENTGDDEEKLHPWPLKISCPQYQTMYRITDEFEFYKALVFSGCHVEFVAIGDPRGCASDVDIIPLPSPNLPDRKNCSDFHLYDLCHGVPLIPALSVHWDSSIFCLYRCEESLPEISTCPPRLIHVDGILFGPDMLPSVFLEFGSSAPTFDERVELGEEETCPMGQWRTSQGICANVYCPPGKLLKKIGNFPMCQSATPSVRGLGYDVNFYLVAMAEVDPYDIVYLDLAIENRFRNVSDKAVLNMEYNARYCPVSGGTSDDAVFYRKMVGIHVSGYIIAPPQMSRDEFEEEAVPFLLQGQWDLRLGGRYFGPDENVSLLLMGTGVDMRKVLLSTRGGTRGFYPYALAPPPFPPPRPVNKRSVKMHKHREAYHVDPMDFSDTGRAADKKTSSINSESARRVGGGFTNDIPFPNIITFRNLLSPSNISDHQIDRGVDSSRQFSEPKRKDKIQTVEGKDDRFATFQDTAVRDKHAREFFRNTMPAESSSVSKHFENDPSLYSQKEYIADELYFNSDHTHPAQKVEVSESMEHSDDSLSHHRSHRSQRSGSDSHPQKDRSLPCVEEQFPTIHKDMMYIPNKLPDYKDNVERFKSDFIDLVPSIRCPHVRADIIDLDKLGSNRLRFTISIFEKEISATFDPQSMVFQGGKLLICVDVLDILLLEPESGPSSPSNETLDALDVNTNKSTTENVTEPSSDSNFLTINTCLVAMAVFVSSM